MRDLPAGRYFLNAARTGYALAGFGATSPESERAVPIDLKPGASFQNAHFRLIRGGVITGRLTDAFGEPSIDTSVTIGRAVNDAGGRRFAALKSTRTDDRGVYRFWGLRRGEYYLLSRPPVQAIMSSRINASTATTMYPGVSTLHQATGVFVTEGEEIESVDFRVVPVRYARVAVTVFDSSGSQTDASVSVREASLDAGLSAPVAGLSSNGRGDFAIHRLEPGEYEVVAVAKAVKRTPEFGVAHFATDGSDTAVAVHTSRASRFAGTVSVAAESSALSGTALQVRALRVDPSLPDAPVFGIDGRAAGEILSNGEFEITVLPGRRLIQVIGLPAGWGIASTTIAGREVVGRPIDFKAAEDVIDTRIVVTDRLPKLAASVIDEFGTPVGGDRVVVFSKDRTLWSLGAGTMFLERANQEGRVLVRGLRPGEYWLATLADTVGDLPDRSELARVAETAITVVVTFGAPNPPITLRTSRGSQPK